MTTPVEPILEHSTPLTRRFVGGSLLTAGLLVAGGLALLSGENTVDAATTAHRELPIESLDEIANLTNLTRPKRLPESVHDARALNPAPRAGEYAAVRNAHYEATSLELAFPPIDLVDVDAKQRAETPQPSSSIWLTGTVKPIDD